MWLQKHENQLECQSFWHALYFLFHQHLFLIFVLFFANYSEQITSGNGYIAILKDDFQIVSKTVPIIIVTRYTLNRWINSIDKYSVEYKKTTSDRHSWLFIQHLFKLNIVFVCGMTLYSVSIVT